jgi:hypothetical protein
MHAAPDEASGSAAPAIGAVARIISSPFRIDSLDKRRLDADPTGAANRQTGMAWRCDASVRHA